MIEGPTAAWSAANRPWGARRSLFRGWATHPVLVAGAVAAVLHVAWLFLLANSGGDIAAQDAWAEFARDHPGSAYSFGWYGGMHPVSYSVLSPYVMALLGVRTTLILAGVASTMLLARLLCNVRDISRPLLPAVYGAFAVAANTASGRVTFGLGILFALGALSVVVTWPPGRPRSWSVVQVRVVRGAMTALLAAISTLASPVAGLFLGLVAAALWLRGRRAASYAVGLPPVAVVLLSAWLFPFSGHEPIGWISIILPLILGGVGVLMSPREWRTVRIVSGVYLVAVLFAWLVPTPIGTNIVRLPLMFSGVVIVAAVARVDPARLGAGWWRRRVQLWRAATRVPVLMAMALATATIWQLGVMGRDLAGSSPGPWAMDVSTLVDQLDGRNAELGRVEVVPTRSHREAAALLPHVNLARGWNRQADAGRNAIFYDEDAPLTAVTYREWLDRWGVRYVVLSNGEPDHAAVEEAALVQSGLSYLTPVWSDANWQLFQVVAPRPIAAAPAVVTGFDNAELTLYLPRPGTVMLRIPYSPWLSVLDDQGDPVQIPTAPAEGEPYLNLDGCLSTIEIPASSALLREDPNAEVTDDEWTVLHAPHAGRYTIGAPYKVPRGTPCPS